MANTKSLLNEVREKQFTKLYEDDWTAVAAERTGSGAQASARVRWSAVRRGVDAKIATDSLLSEVRARQTEEFFGGDWTALVAANPQECPSRTPAPGHWDTAATDALLDDMRAQQTGELFEKDRAAPPRSPPPAAAGGHEAGQGENAAAAGGASPESKHRSALRAGVASVANTRALPTEVREEQCTQLYEDEWAAAAAERATDDARASAQGRWSAVRTGVSAKIAADSLLSEVRARQTEAVFEGDWAAAAARAPGSPAGGRHGATGRELAAPGHA